MEIQFLLRNVACGSSLEDCIEQGASRKARDCVAGLATLAMDVPKSTDQSEAEGKVLKNLEEQWQGFREGIVKQYCN